MKNCTPLRPYEPAGYYDGVIFHRYVSVAPVSVGSFAHQGCHRVVPDFLVQTGDRTGTGGGGESFYGGVSLCSVFEQHVSSMSLNRALRG